MSIVCNSSPLIFLSKIDCLQVLFKLFDNIYIPQAVYKEIILSGKKDTSQKIIEEAISVGDLVLFDVRNNTAVKALSGRLHPGEVEVIVGAIELGIKDVVLDDLNARRKAKQLNLNIIGTLGILTLAFENEMLFNYEEEIQKLISIGFRISPALLRKMLNNLKAVDDTHK